MEFNHLAPAVRERMSLSDAERIEFIENPLWIDFESGTRLMEHLNRLLQIVPQTRMPNLFVVGDSSYGKTTLMHRFKSRYAKSYIDDDGNAVGRVLMIELKSARIADIYLDILALTASPYSYSTPVAALRQQAAEILREVGTRMLIIDEFQVLNAAAARAKYDLMNELKWICNQLQIIIVCVGVKTTLQLLQLDPQYASRFDVIELLPWELDQKFQGFLKAYESALPLKKPSVLYDVEACQLIHEISGGLTGNIRKLLKECAKQAITSGAEMIDAKLLEANAWMKPNGRNGFRVQYM